MIEIFVLIFLCRKSADTARQKGLSPGRWKLYTVLAWFAAEFIGFFVGGIFFGVPNINDLSSMFPLILFALVCAFGGYLIVRAILEKMPDEMEDDINKIGE